MLRTAIRQTLAAADCGGLRAAAAGRCCAETTTTPRAARLCATGRTPRRAGRWWQSSPRTPRRCLRRCGAGPSAADAADGVDAELLAAVSGQDLEAGPPTTRCASRAVSLGTGSYPPQTPTPDTAARAPREASTATRASIAVDRDSELITDTAVTAGNAADASAAPALIKDLTSQPQPHHRRTTVTGSGSTDSSSGGGAAAVPAAIGADVFAQPSVVLYGHRAYGSGEFQQFLRGERINARCRTQKPAGARRGSTARTASTSMWHAGAVTCPAGVRVEIRLGRGGDGAASASARPATVASSAGCAPRPKAASNHPRLQTRSRPRRCPAPAKGTRPGGTTTAPRAPKSSASSPTSNC